MKNLLKHLRKKLISGIFIIIPLYATYVVVTFLFKSVDSILAGHVNGLLEKLFGIKVPGVGIATSLILIYLIGLLGSNVLFKKFMSYGERLLNKIPLVKAVYSSSKQLMDALSVTSSSQAFRQVVYVEYPKRGVLAIGFLTNEFKDASGKEYCAVFIPTTPNPTSGFLLFYPKNEVILTDSSIDCAFKAIMSGGIVFQGMDTLHTDVCNLPAGNEPPKA